MKEWTDGARRALDAYLDQAGRSLGSDGAESGEVVEDIRRHVEEELRGINSDVVTAAILGSVSMLAGARCARSS
jgi:hypothetical protein